MIIKASEITLHAFTTSVMVPDLIDLGRQSHAALGNHVQRYWLGVPPNIK